MEVSPSPVYGARLLSGLRVKPSREFKSRHLRQRDNRPNPLVVWPVVAVLPDANWKESRM